VPDQPWERRDEAHGEPSTLYYASFTGLESCVEELVREDSKIDTQTRHFGTAIDAGLYGTALQAASKGGHLEIVQLLLNHGADVNIRRGDSGTALQAASAIGYLEIVQLLLNHGADDNIQGEYYGTALQAASARGHLEIVQLLLNHGADINIQGRGYGTALQAASVEGHLEIVRLLQRVNGKEEEEEERRPWKRRKLSQG
jgi:ankyrin repeat protein